jgi:putative restriction endonuclease
MLEAEPGCDIGGSTKIKHSVKRSQAATGERTLPVLEAAHIKPYGSGGPHQPENGLLLRSDLHTLFDEGS